MTDENMTAVEMEDLRKKIIDAYKKEYRLLAEIVKNLIEINKATNGRMMYTDATLGDCKEVLSKLSSKEINSLVQSVVPFRQREEILESIQSLKDIVQQTSSHCAAIEKKLSAILNCPDVEGEQTQ